ncbi:dihydrofolate reductase family protein [Pseudoruegeria sp. HB172150]|uniref:dihydrofolate reductase family protein n=1 Tax=Pseudoruegeria sp. HB172150 TaxID=2721164 RepID=UPI00155671DE|nr:dihydrofolate reductase family protein [Pseudoruegeria sp. HB172150]
MTRLRIESFAVSLDGYGAGPEQSRDNPMGRNGMSLHGWAFATRTFRKMFGHEGGSTGEDDRIAKRGFESIGAWIMGRNMFTHERGDWFDPDWKGWWGDEPPYHCDVYVLTHHPRPALEHGGTTFHFVTDGIRDALDRARESAKGKDIRLGGGTKTLRAYLSAGLVDEAHFAISPVLLGRGEAVWTGLDLPGLGYTIKETTVTDLATHIRLQRE